MKPNVIRFAITLLIVVVCAGGLWLAGSYVLPQLKNVGASAQKALYYCPMHPTYTSDRPGDCPICNMKLVKKDSDAATHAGGARHSEKSRFQQAGTTAAPREFTLQEILKMKPGEICLLHKCKMGTCLIAMTEEFARLGKCPHCGEDLGVIVKDLMPAGYAGVKLTPAKQQLIGVKTDQVKKTAISKTIRTVGRIAYDPELYQAEEEYVQAAEALKKAETGTIPEIKDQASKLVDSAKIKLRLLG